MAKLPELTDEYIATRIEHIEKSRCFTEQHDLELQALRALKETRANLRTYGRHEGRCAVERGSLDCDCGWDDILLPERPAEGT